MDSLHLFTIPKWLLYTLLPEIWAIIFHWKWRLEMIDIHKVLLDKTSTIKNMPVNSNKLDIWRLALLNN